MDPPAFLVEIGERFEVDLLTCFPEEDGPSGHPPSWSTFLDREEEMIKAAVLARWPDMQIVKGNPNRRVLVIVCETVRAVVVEGLLRDDGVVELVACVPDLRPWPGSKR